MLFMKIKVAELGFREADIEDQKEDKTTFHDLLKETFRAKHGLRNGYPSIQ